MPLTKSGNALLEKLKKFYNKDKGEAVFYGMIAKKKKGSEKWHQKKMKEKK